MRQTLFTRVALPILGLILLMAGGARTVEAQTGKVTGVITDSATGRPIEGVQVVLQGTGYGQLTAANGRYVMVGVRPGTFTLVARRIGYGSQQTSISVLIDVTREVNLRLSSSSATLQTMKIVETTAPLIERNATGTTNTISAQEIEALPVRSIREVLALQPGFTEIPSISTDLTSFTAARRNDSPALLIRGGRAGETMTLIDDIPVNNFLFGGSTLDVTTQAILSAKTIQGFMEPQYGNALSGVVSLATREGGETLAGSMSYETSRLGASLGSTRDNLRGYDFVEGFLSGPVPATNNRLRFAVAGRTQERARQVLEFDNKIYNPFVADTVDRFNYQGDLTSGWRALGYNSSRDLFGKLTFLFTPTAKLSASYINYARESMGLDFDWMLTGYSAADACVAAYQTRYGNLLDVRNACDNFYDKGRTSTVGRPLGTERNAYTNPSVQSASRNLYTARYEQTMGRLYFKLVGGRLDQSRVTCATFFSGICLDDRIADTNFNNRFVTAGVTSVSLTPVEGTDQIAGRDGMKTSLFRGDAVLQATDHHNLQVGVFYQQHNLNFFEARDVGLNNVQIQRQSYAAKPWDGAAYFQDKIEYDFLTVNLGARFDYGRADGTFLVNPIDPTNGTTQLTVCNDPTRFGLPADFASYTDPKTGEKFSGFAACQRSGTKNDSSVAVAFRDDMGPAPARRSFSPRIGFSFPVTEVSNAYFNFGVYYQNPLYNNLYQGTSIGVTDPATGEKIEGTPKAPLIQIRNQFLGNPRLRGEQTTQYEFGFNTELGRHLGLQLVAFSKDQAGLTGIRNGGFLTGSDVRVFDPGVTYGSNAPSYTISVNQDFQTVRGFQVFLNRNLSNYWSGRLNYGFIQASSNAAPPDLETQRTQEEGDIQPRTEFRSDVDQRHSVSGSFSLIFGQRVPKFRASSLLKNTSSSLTAQMVSGFPYTPALTFTGGTNDRLLRNSGSGPNTFTLNLQLRKGWDVANARYGAFVRVSNLLDRKNCAQVFATTGNCDGGASPQARLRAGNFTGEGEGSTFFDRPQYQLDRRFVNAGLTVSF